MGRSRFGGCCLSVPQGCCYNLQGRILKKGNRAVQELHAGSDLGCDKTGNSFFTGSRGTT